MISKKNGTSKPEKEKVLANSYDLLGIIESFKDKLSSDSIDVLRKLSEDKVDSSCVNLIRAKDNSKIIKTIIDEYKAAQDAKVKNDQDLIELDGKISLDASAVEAAEMDIENSIEFTNDLSNLKHENQLIKDQIEQYDKLISDEDQKIANSEQSTEDSKMRYQEWRLALAASDAVQDSKNQYTSAMFNNLIDTVGDFWDEIDKGHSNADIEYDENTNQIQLRDKTSKTPILLKHSDGGGKASSGQFEKALLCMAFARASLTGLQMPVFIDDAMGDMDPKHKQRAIDSAATNFGQVIFVTNTEDTVLGKITPDCIIQTIGSKSEGKKSIVSGGFVVKFLHY